MIATKQKTITVAIDGGDHDPCNDPGNGIQRLISSTITYIEKIRDKTLKLDYYHFGRIQHNQKTTRIKTHQLPFRFFSSFFLPIAAKWNKNSVFIGFSGVLPPLIRMMKIRSVICIHDLGFLHHPENYHNPDRMKWQTEYALYGADRIVVFSKYIQSQIRTLYPKVPTQKIIQIYPGANHLHSAKKASFLHKYFLYVGVIKKTKNLEMLFSLFHEYQIRSKDKKTKLYLIGKAQMPYWDELQQTDSYKSIKDSIRFISNVSDRDLSRYYQNASAFINVSHDEGFCYPVIECLSYNTPVLVNKLPLYQEFMSYFPNLFILQKKSDFIEKMILAINEKISFLKEKRRHPFTWDLFTKQLLEVIKHVSL